MRSVVDTCILIFRMTWPQKFFALNHVRVGEPINLSGDRRSFHAFARGADDGRAGLYTAFCRQMLAKKIRVDEDQFESIYARLELATYVSTSWLHPIVRAPATRYLMRARIWSYL